MAQRPPSLGFAGMGDDAYSSVTSAIVFMLFVVSGSAYIIVAKLIGVAQIYVTFVPVLTMIGYAVLIWLARNLRLRDDQAGDNLYYMGFLFTLTSLGVSLYQFNAARAAEEIVQNFGIAIGSTITGIALRVIFNQMRQDPIEVERTMRLELADAARRVRRELDATVVEFGYIRRISQQSAADSFDHVAAKIDEIATRLLGAIADVASRSALPLEDASQRSADALTDASNIMADGLAATARQLAADIEGLSASVVDISATINEVAAKLERLQTPDGVIEVRIELGDPVPDRRGGAVFHAFRSASRNAAGCRRGGKDRRRRLGDIARRAARTRRVELRGKPRRAQVGQGIERCGDADARAIHRQCLGAGPDAAQYRGADRPRIPQFRRGGRQIGLRHGVAGPGLQRHPGDDPDERGNLGDRLRKAGGPRRGYRTAACGSQERGDRVMSGSIARQTASYRQGLVLGLTMAEIMLLLVFSLLIAIGVALAAERAGREQVMLRLRGAEAAAAASGAVVEEIRRNPRIAEFLDRAAAKPVSAQAVDQFWRTLVESDEIVDAMERRGVSRAALRQGGEYFARMQQLKEAGFDPDKALKGAALAAAIEDALPRDAVAGRTPEQLAALVAKGLAASAMHGEPNPKDGHTWPPIINLSEAGGYYFATRSAELQPEFEAILRTAVVDKLLEIAASFQVDVIEVIGHTDERALSGGLSNLDRELPAATSGTKGVGVLQPADNAGLGLARALAVVEVLASEPGLRNFRILPLSGAQLIGTDGRLTRWDEQGDVRERRRIEIRMRKSM